MRKRTWSGRTFTSLCSLVSFVLLFFTGLILYFQPHGRVAYWTKWRFLALEKDQWGSIHIYSGLLFLLAGVFHIYYNWNLLIKYLSDKTESALRYKRELITSSVVFIWILISGIWSVPPLVYVNELGEMVKNSWVTSPELEPPFGHAELVSLQTFCKKQRIPLDRAVMELRKAGFTVESPKSTLVEIAESKQTSGMGVYEIIKGFEAKPEAMKPGALWTVEKVEETFSGTGIGNKTIGQVIKELQLDSHKVYRRLKSAGVVAKDNDRFKSVADKNNTTPIKLMATILVENGQIQ